MRSSSKGQAEAAAAAGRGRSALVAAVGFDGQPLGGRAPVELAVRLTVIGAAESRLASLKLAHVAALEEEYSGASAPPAPEGEQRPRRPDKQWWKEEVAAALGISCWQALTLERTARVLRTMAPRTAQCLAEGLITPAHAQAIGDNLHGLTEAQAANLDEQLMHAALSQSLTAYQLRGRAERARAACNPPEHQEEQQNMQARRSLDLWRRKADGMGYLSGWLTSEAAAIVEAAINALAHPLASGDERTKSQRWHDGLEEICARALTEGDLPADRDGAPAGIHVLVPFSTLFGHSGPGEIPKHGLISPHAVRRLGCTAWWAPVITSPDGHHALYLGRTQRLPNRALRRYLRVRDGGCQFPGCTIGPARCEPHHAHTWGSGGYTDPDNCVLLCSRHHHAAHEGGWKLRRTPEGATTWTSPAGQVSTVAPPDLHADDRRLRNTAKAALMRLLNHAALAGLAGGPDNWPDSWPVEPTPIPLPPLADLTGTGQPQPQPQPQSQSQPQSQPPGGAPAEPAADFTLEELEHIADLHDPPPRRTGVRRRPRPTRPRRDSGSDPGSDPDDSSPARSARSAPAPAPASGNPQDDDEPPF